MSAKSVQVVRKEFLFDSANMLGATGVFAAATGSTGAETLGAEGLNLDCDANELCFVDMGAILPYEIDNLKCVEFLTNIVTTGTSREFAWGVSNNAGAAANPDTPGVKAFLRVTNNVVTVDYDDGTNSVTDGNVGGVTVETGAGVWIWIRLDFKQDILTQSPPSLSKGNQVTFAITNTRGYRRRLTLPSAFDLSAAKNTHVAPFCSSVAPAVGTCNHNVKMIAVEYITPN